MAKNTRSTKKKTFQEVSNLFYSHRYQLPDGKYVNATTKLRSLCPAGHEYFVSYDCFSSRGFRCPECSGNRKKTIEEVQDIFTKNGYTPLFSSYNKNIEKLLVKCPKEHTWSVSLCNFNKGVRCPECSGNAPRFDIVSIKEILNKEGYGLVSTKYENMNSPVETICPNKHAWNIRIGDFKVGYRCPMCNPKFESKQEIELLKWIQSHYPSASKFRARDNGRFQFEIDIYIPELKLGIEYCGIFWHCEKFKGNKYHFDKMQKCNKLGIRLITVFEDEWLERENQVKGFLLSILGKNKVNLFARKLILKELPKNISNDFLKENHIQGSAPSELRLGLWNDQELVAVMTGNAHHRQGNDKVFILNRLAFKYSTSISGGSSKLLKALTNYAKDKGYQRIISWSDNRWSEGNVYKKLGFELEGELPPDYSYVTGKTRQSKQSNKKSSLIKKGSDPFATEKEMAKALNLYRIYDCGKKRWGIDLNGL